eukprot:jgi/Ulvmu1/5349/UM022_0143.1
MNTQVEMDDAADLQGDNQKRVPAINELDWSDLRPGSRQLPRSLKQHYTRLCNKDSNSMSLISGIDANSDVYQGCAPQKMISDKIVNTYCALLQEHDFNEHRRGVEKGRCWFCNSYLYAKLTEQLPTNGTSYALVCRWRAPATLCRTSNQFCEAYGSIRQLQKIFVPIHKHLHRAVAMIQLHLNDSEPAEVVYIYSI